MKSIFAKNIDMPLLITILVLLAAGVIVIYTGTSSFAHQKGFSQEFYVFSHLKRILIGLVLMFFFAKLDYYFLFKYARPAFFIILSMMFYLVLTQTEVKGAVRWISLGFMTIQPSEFMKLPLLAFVCMKLVKIGNEIQDFGKGFISPLVGVFIASVLLMKQPNFSMAIILILTAFILLFVAGVRLSHLSMTILLFLLLAVVVGFMEPYRLNRIKAWWDPQKYPESSYQLINSQVALGNGGILGTGIARGTQKLGFLPEAHKDVAFAVIGEEMGFVGTFGIVFVLFGVFTYRGFVIARNAKTRFAKLLAIAITSSISLNVILHVFVSIGLLPTTGQPLPFISYGGSNLIASLISIGVLLSISNPNKGDRIKEVPLKSAAYSMRSI